MRTLGYEKKITASYCSSSVGAAIVVPLYANEVNPTKQGGKRLTLRETKR